MNLELHSVGFTAASLLLGVGILCLAFSRDASRSGATGQIGAGSIVIAAALFGLILRGIIPDFLSVVIANTLLMLGFVLLMKGCQRFCGQSTRIPWWIAALLVLQFASLLWNTYRIADLNFRVVIVAVTGLVLNARWAYFMWRHFQVPPMTTPRRLISYAPQVLSALFAAIALDAEIRAHPITRLEEAGIPFLIAALILCATVSAVALLMLWLEGEADLLAAKLRTESILSVLPDALSLQDREGRFLSAQSAAQQIEGLRLSQRELWESYPPEIVRARLACIQEALHTGKLQVIEYPLEADGKSYWLEARVIPFEKDKVLTLIRDVTEQKSAERVRAEGEASLRLISENMGDIIVLYNADFTMRYVSPSVKSVLGYEPAQLLGLSPYQFIHPDDAELARTTREQVLAGQARIGIQYRMRNRAGTYVWMEVRGQPVFGSDGAVVSYITSSHDITERRSIDEQLRLAAMVAHSASEGILVTDAEGSIQWANDAFVRLSGFARDGILGAQAAALLGYENSESDARLRRQALEQEGMIESEVNAKRKNGESFPAWYRVSVVRDPNGTATHFVHVISDRSQERKTQEIIEHLSRHDALTRLPNRASFMQTLKDAIDAAPPDHSTIALLSINLDRFKRLNGLLGQADGDRLLQQIADRLLTILEPGHAVLSRLGGDEFVILMSALASPEAASEKARAVMDTLAKPFTLGIEKEVFVSASIGISRHPDDGSTADAIMKASTTAMHHAKRSGGNAYRSFSAEMDSRDAGQLQREARLRRTAESKEGLSMSYQPKLGLPENRITGVEALIRWNHPELGNVPPTQFIPLAEDLGLIHGLGEWVLSTVCKEAVARQAAGFEPLCVAVNLSPKQLLDEHLPDKIQHILDETGLAPHWLELEVTETCVMIARDQAVRLLDRLRGLGISLCLDDFGTGHSSLSYLSSLPVDSIKIDRSFVTGLPEQQTSVVICKAVIAMGRALSLKIVAEGVERTDEFDFLREYGCDEIQGNLIAVPMPDAQLREFLRNQNFNASRYRA